MIAVVDETEKTPNFIKNTHLTPEEICAKVWIQICLSPNKKEIAKNFQVLGAFQEDIADGFADPRWKKFLDSLPGFRDYCIATFLDEDSE